MYQQLSRIMYLLIMTEMSIEENIFAGRRKEITRGATPMRRGRMRSSLKVGLNDSTNASESASTLCNTLFPTTTGMQENAFRKLQ